MLSLLKLILLLGFGGLSIMFVLTGISILRTPNHVWEENRRRLKAPDSEVWDRYRKDRLYEECERVWSSRRECEKRMQDARKNRI